MNFNTLQYQDYFSQDDYTLQFQYGHDKQRRKTTFYDQNGLAMEKYFVGLYEKELKLEWFNNYHLKFRSH